jgi:hypothetical protein
MPDAVAVALGGLPSRPAGCIRSYDTPGAAFCGETEKGRTATKIQHGLSGLKNEVIREVVLETEGDELRRGYSNGLGCHETWTFHLSLHCPREPGGPDPFQPPRWRRRWQIPPYSRRLKANTPIPSQS